VLALMLLHIDFSIMSLSARHPAYRHREEERNHEAIGMGDGCELRQPLGIAIMTHQRWFGAAGYSGDDLEVSARGPAAVRFTRGFHAADCS
jgi:hypothetical protein